MSGNGEFGLGEVNDYYPDYGGIDWRARFEKLLARAELPLPLPAYFECTDELGELCEQITQENTSFYMNRTDKNFDTLAVYDPRDDSFIWFTRQQLGASTFQELFDQLNKEVQVIITKYPLRSVAEFVLGMMTADTGALETDGLPPGFQ